jgi:hypothetical protein
MRSDGDLIVVNRALLGIGAGGLATAAFLCALALGQNRFGGSLLLNLGTEILGIAATVAVVDALLEQRKDDAEATRIGWGAMHELDHAVWVWQGGRREYFLDELWDLVTAIGDEDQMAAFTAGLFLNIGGRAGNTRRTRDPILRRHDALATALKSLSRLSAVRDSTDGLAAGEVRNLLEEAITNLATHLDLTLPVAPTGASAVRDPSAKAQERRPYGRVLGS